MPISLTARSKSHDVDKSSSASFVKVQTAVTKLQRLIFSVAIAALQLFIAFFCKVKESFFRKAADSTDQKANGMEKPLLNPHEPRSDSTSAQKDETVGLQNRFKRISSESQSISSLDSSSSSVKSSSSLKTQLSELSHKDLDEFVEVTALHNPAREVKKAELFKDTQKAFAKFYPQTFTSSETFGDLADAMEQLEKDIPRAKIFIGGDRIENIDQFKQILEKTPFAKNQKQLAELLSQAAIAPTTNAVFKKANEHFDQCIKDPDGLMLLVDQHGPLQIDLHPLKTKPDLWVAEGTIDMHLSLNHPLFADDDGYRAIVERLRLHYRVELPKELAAQDRWTVTFNHSATAEKSAK